MSARDFPPECPVFRVRHNGWHCGAGAIVEGVDWFDMTRNPSTGAMIPSRGYIGCRVLTEELLTDAGQEHRHPQERWPAATFAASTLQPLTPAAREWLAYAKERAA